MSKRDVTMTVPVNDGLQNLVTSLGSTRDASMYDTFTKPVDIKYDLEAAYRNWLTRKCIDIPVDDAFRKDRYIVTDETDNDKIEAFYELESTLDVKGKFIDAAKQARIYGGAVLLLGTQDLDWSEPISDKSLLTHLVVLSRYEVTSVQINRTDITKPNYRQAEYYSIGAVKVHYTRCIRFDGDLLPFDDYANNGYWHGSVVSRLNDAVKPAISAIQNLSVLLNQASTDIFKTPDFMNKLASMGEESAMISRFQTAAYMRSNLNMIVLDSEEEYERKTITLSGLSDTMLSFLRVVAGAADIPATRLLGDAASGLNATGEGDLRNYYDHVAALQGSVYAPRYAMIDPLLQTQIWGGRPDGYCSRFEPLWQISDAERAAIELQRAQRDAAYLTAGVIDPAIVARALQENETYTISPEYIEALESYKEETPNVPTMPETPVVPDNGPAAPVETPENEPDNDEQR